MWTYSVGKISGGAMRIRTWDCSKEGREVSTQSLWSLTQSTFCLGRRCFDVRYEARSLLVNEFVGGGVDRRGREESGQVTSATSREVGNDDWLVRSRGSGDRPSE